MSSYYKENGCLRFDLRAGRSRKDAIRAEKAEYEDSWDRVEVERAFSLAKRRFGLAQIHLYLKETTQIVMALSFLVLNLSKVQCAQFVKVIFAGL